MHPAREIGFGFSPCPNDTFSFHALISGRVDTPGFALRPHLADVEQLNHLALLGRLEMTKLSFHALGLVLDRYALLGAGAALGRGCGPLLVARPGVSLEQTGREILAVPGRHTTAHLLWSLYLGQPPRVEPMLFSEVMPRVAGGEFAAGLIIHEGRFTYEQHGLVALLDLGAWWEELTGLPLPLGCIALRRDLGSQAAETLTRALRQSVAHAQAHPDQSRDYVRTHAQELEPKVMQSHIELYVNNFSLELGSQGRQAVQEMLARGRAAGLLPSHDGELELCRPVA